MLIHLSSTANLLSMPDTCVSSSEIRLCLKKSRLLRLFIHDPCSAPSCGHSKPLPVPPSPRFDPLQKGWVVKEGHTSLKGGEGGGERGVPCPSKSTVRALPAPSQTSWTDAKDGCSILSVAVAAGGRRWTSLRASTNKLSTPASSPGVCSSARASSS